MSSTGPVKNQSADEPPMEPKDVQQPRPSERFRRPLKRLSYGTGGVLWVDTDICEVICCIYENLYNRL